jgi:Salmonella virulence plasmid 65kDa B protein
MKYSIGLICLTISSAVCAGVNVTSTGSSAYDIPLKVLPGIASLIPKLSLSYNSQNGLGLSGFGWKLEGLSSISRCQKTKLQDGFDFAYADYNGDGSTAANNVATSTDAFCLNGERLIKNDTSPGIANGEYRLEHEKFSRVVYSSSNDTWTVDSKDGLHYTYGGTTAKGNFGVNRTWPVYKIQDNQSNVITFNFIQGYSSNDIRIDNITYGTNNNNQIKFVYEDRPDVWSIWNNSIQNVTEKRLRLIQETWKDPSDTTGSTQVEVRRYLLSYTQSTSSNNVANTGRSLLTKVQECSPISGQGASVMGNTANIKTNQKCFAPYQFSYGQTKGGFDSTYLNMPDFSDASGYSDSTIYPTFQMVDVDNNGQKDICARTNSGLTCWLQKNNNGSITWDNTGWAVQTDFSNAASLDYNRIQYIDIDGDGLIDACARFTTGIKCYLNSGSGFNKRVITGPSWSDANGWNNDKYGSTITFIDLNGDSFGDVCGRYSDGLRCAYYNNSTGTFDNEKIVAKSLSDANLVYKVYPNGYDSSSTVPADSSIDSMIDTYRSIRYIDQDNDGLVDLCYTNIGSGNSGGFITYKSGLVELMCQSNDGTGLFDNKGSVWFSSNSSTAKLSDFNYSYVGLNDGKLSVNWSIPGTNTSGTTYYYYNRLFQEPFVFTDLNSDHRQDYCFRNMKGIRCWMNGGIDRFVINIGGVNTNFRAATFASMTIPGLTDADSLHQGLFPDNDVNGNSTGWSLVPANNFQWIDFNQDNKFDLCARGKNGMQCYRNTMNIQSCTMNQSNTAINGTTAIFSGPGSCSVSSGFVSDQFGFAASGCTDQSSGLCVSDAAGYGTDSVKNTFRYFGLPNGKAGLFIRSPSGTSKVYAYGGTSELSSSTQTNTDLLVSVKEGASPTVNINYQTPGLNNSLYIKGSLSTRKNSADVSSYPVFDLPATMPLVTSMNWTDPFTSQVFSTNYQYLGLVAQLRRGQLGFGAVRKTMQPSNTWMETRYRQDWPLIGLVDTVLEGNGNKSGISTDTSVSSNWVKSTQYSYSVQDLSNTGNTVNNTAGVVENGCLSITPKTVSAQSTLGRYFVYPYESIETTRSINDLSKTIKTVISDTVMDTLGTGAPSTWQGNPTCLSVKTKDGVNSTVYESVTNNSWDTSKMASSWMLNLLSQSSIQYKAPTSSFVSATLGASQGNYAAAYNPNVPTNQMGPVLPNIMPWFIPVMTLLLQ